MSCLGLQDGTITCPYELRLPQIFLRMTTCDMAKKKRLETVKILKLVMALNYIGNEEGVPPQPYQPHLWRSDNPC